MSYMGPDQIQGNLPPNSVPAGVLQAASVAWPNLTPDVQSLFVGMKNRIINGDCRIAQRGNNASFAAGISGFGGPDRFGCANQASGTFVQQQTSTFTVGTKTRTGVQQFVSVAAGAFSAGQYWGGIQQVIEGYNAFDLIGQPVAISFWFGAIPNGTYGGVLRDGTGTLTFPFTFNYNGGGTMQLVSVLVPAIPANAVVPMNNASGLILTIGAVSGNTFVAPSSGAWIAGNYLQPPGVMNWSTVVNNWIGLTDLQLEAGVICTPFERRQQGLEVLLCQRYYQVISDFLCGGYQGAGGIVYADATLPVPMRATPSGVLLNAATYFNASGYSLNSASNSKFRTSITIGSAGYGYGYGASIGFLAEL
jgi:hypothetical protein